MDQCKVTECGEIVKEISTQGSGRAIKLMDMEFTLLKQVIIKVFCITIKAIFQSLLNKGKAQSHLKMEMFIKGFIKTETHTDTASIYGKMALFTREILFKD